MKIYLHFQVPLIRESFYVKGKKVPKHFISSHIYIIIPTGFLSAIYAQIYDIYIYMYMYT